MTESSILRVGVIGVGMMGADHAERIAQRVANATLVAVADPDRRAGPASWRTGSTGSASSTTRSS